MGRTLAKAAGIGKGIAKGYAGFLDFKKSFEDAMRKNKWEKERDTQQAKERRSLANMQITARDKIAQLQARTARQGMITGQGYSPAEGDIGKFLAGGDVPMNRQDQEVPEGFVEIPAGGNIRKDPTYQSLQRMTPNQVMNLLADPFKRDTLKTEYPDIFKKFEAMIKNVFGQAALDNINKRSTSDRVMDTDWDTNF